MFFYSFQDLFGDFQFSSVGMTRRRPLLCFEHEYLFLFIHPVEELIDDRCQTTEIR
jgi:hypothetical protein